MEYCSTIIYVHVFKGSLLIEVLPGMVLASSPGHSHVFNVTRRKGGGLEFLRVTLKTWE